MYVFMYRDIYLCYIYRCYTTSLLSLPATPTFFSLYTTKPSLLLFLLLTLINENGRGKARCAFRLESESTAPARERLQRNAIPAPVTPPPPTRRRRRRSSSVAPVYPAGRLRSVAPLARFARADERAQRSPVREARRDRVAAPDVTVFASRDGFCARRLREQPIDGGTPNVEAERRRRATSDERSRIASARAISVPFPGGRWRIGAAWW